MAIAQQLQAESAQQNNTSFSQAVTLGAGSSRLLLVTIVGERTSYAAPTSVTYGGVALSLVTDGSQTAENITGTTAGVHFYALKEASLPADGSNTLAVTWPGAAVNYCVGWQIFTGVDQGNARDVKVLGQTTTATSITITLDSGATTDCVVCASYKNDTTGTIAITISGAGVTEDFDISLTTGGARAAAGTDLPAVASGTIACVSTVSSTARRIIVGVRLAEAAAVVSIDASSLSFGALTLSGDFTPVSATSYLSHTESATAVRDETVSADCDLFLVAVLETDSNGVARTVELDGVALTVVTPLNNFVQLHYMLNPPTGTFSLGVDGTGISTIIAAQYAGIDSFESGQQGSVDNASYSPSAAALIVHAISAGATGTEPVAGTTERHDTTGEWYGDRIVGSGGSVTVGTTGTTDPDYAGAIFLSQVGEEEVNIDASSLSFGALSLSGSLTPVVSVAGSVSFPELTLSGGLTISVSIGASSLTFPELTVAGSLTPVVTLTGALALPEMTLNGSVAPVVALDGSLTFPGVTASGGFTPAVALDGSLTLPGLSVSGNLSPVVSLSGALELGALALEGGFTPAVTMTGTLAFPELTVSGSFTIENGEVTFDDSQLDFPGLSLSGSFESLVSFSGELSVSSLQLDGSFGPLVSFSGELSVAALQVSGQFVSVVEMTGTLALPELTVAGEFEPVSFELTITGTLSFPAVTLSGSFVPALLLSGELQLPALQLSGQLSPVVQLSGDLTLPEMILSGSFSLVGEAGIPGTQGPLTAFLPLQVTTARLPEQTARASLPTQATKATRR